MYTAPAPLIGRETELADIAAHLDSDALPAVVLVEGEAGIGKTSLCTLVVEAARERGFTTLVTRPVSAEADLALAGLGDLLEPVLDDILDAVPGPQARALRVAFLLEESTKPNDSRALGVAFVSVLRALAEERPLLVVVDDVQWLDPSSAAVLAYAGRRLKGDRIALLLARRVTHADPVTGLLDDVWRLELGGLSSRALHRLLRERLGVVLSRPVLRRIHETSGGNPFYALEIARALQQEGSAPSTRKPLPVPPTLGELLHSRIEALPAETRAALVIVAATSEPRIAVVSAALDADADRALGPAIDAHVVIVEEGWVRFAHPLLADAAYSAVDDDARRDAHRRLAGVIAETEEHARHLALAAEGPDEGVASALEEAAAQARARGASAAAAQLCEHARALTPSDREVDAHRRTITGAWHWFAAGDTGRARVLLEEALAAAQPGAPRAEAMTGLGRLAITEGDQPGAADLLRQALAEAGDDEAVRAEASQSLATALFFMREDLATAHEFEQIAVELAQRVGNVPLYLNALATRGLIETLLGRPEAADTIEATFAVSDVRDERVIAWPAYHRAYFELWVGDPSLAAPMLSSFADEATARGDESSLPTILCSLSLAKFLEGRWAEALRHADDAYELSLQVGQRPQQAWSLAARALVRAGSGDEEPARRDATEALAIAGDRAMGVARIHAVWAIGLLELSLDRPGQAVRFLAPVREQLITAGVVEPGSMRFVPDEIEALVALGRLDEAEAILRWLEEHARVLDRTSALAAATRCRGLVAAARGDKAVAIKRFEEALGWEERARIPFDHARTLLLLGASRRRAKQKAAAREALVQARRLFEGLGAALWAEKASEELARIGGRTASPDVLTPAEQRVAELVAAGRTNKEVAAALFLADRTVEGHLTHIYRKLGIRSRAELARTL